MVEGPFADDTSEALEAKLAEAERAHGQTLRELDRVAGIREELRLAIAMKRGTCLCAHQRHASCQQRRPWCTVSDCVCNTCVLRR